MELLSAHKETESRSSHTGENTMSSDNSSDSRTQTAAIVWATIILLLVGWVTGVAQQGTTPQRGFQPGGSYALSNIETINTTNGDVMLNFPFQLPPGRGGFAAQLGLHYDSKDLDSYVEQ